jgi:hypothetical protein
MLSHRIERETEYLGKDDASTQLHRYYLLFAGIPPSLHIGIIFHSYIVCQRGREFKKGSQGLRFWRLLPKGESISPKQKDHTTT